MPRRRAPSPMPSLATLPLLLLALLLLLLLPHDAHGFGFGGKGDKDKQKEAEAAAAAAANAAAASKPPKQLPKDPPPQVEILTGAFCVWSVGSRGLDCRVSRTRPDRPTHQAANQSTNRTHTHACRGQLLGEDRRRLHLARRLLRALVRALRQAGASRRPQAISLYTHALIK